MEPLGSSGTPLTATAETVEEAYTADQLRDELSGGLGERPGFLIHPAFADTERGRDLVSAPTYFSPVAHNEAVGRALDIVLAIILLVFVLPLMSMCAVAVLVTSRGPLLFTQPRVGRGGALFTCLKFRTMVQHADRTLEEVLKGSVEFQNDWRELQKLRCDPRVTPIGRVLRRYCLDELPQLFNVLAGHMSIVGPRPIVEAEITKYGSSFAHYCSVKPGLTGLWQVSGRHALSYDERVRLDATYANSKSLQSDLVILWRTVPIVLFGLNE